MIVATTQSSCSRRAAAHAVPLRNGSGARRPRLAQAVQALPRLSLPQFQLPWQPKAPPSNPLQAERDELLSLLLGRESSSERASAAGGRRREARASELVDALIASELPFDEARLGGGPWVVVYTRGAPQL